MKLHIPLWKSYFGNDERKRLYIRFECKGWSDWRSGGRNKNQSFKKYYKGFHCEIAMAVTHGKVNYSCLEINYE